MAESNFMTIEEMQNIDLSEPMNQSEFSRLCWLNKSTISRAVKCRRIRLEPGGEIIPGKNLLFFANLDAEKVGDKLFMKYMYYRRALFLKARSD